MNAIVSASSQPGARTAGFVLSSPDIVDGRIAKAQYADFPGYDGQNLSPELHWTGAPEGTRSFVVSMYDRDAPTGSGFWHWVLIDIPAAETGIVSGAGNGSATLPPAALHTLNDASAAGYAGIAPPPGETHDYVITIKALDVDHLPVAPNATGAMVGFVSNMHVLASATLTAKGGN
jgi:Raf kinase inhibitor-like YbhB/YbcL family protein